MIRVVQREGVCQGQAFDVRHADSAAWSSGDGRSLGYFGPSGHAKEHVQCPFARLAATVVSLPIQELVADTRLVRRARHVLVGLERHSVLEVVEAVGRDGETPDNRCAGGHGHDDVHATKLEIIEEALHGRPDVSVRAGEGRFAGGGQGPTIAGAAEPDGAHECRPDVETDVRSTPSRALKKDA